MRYDQAAANVRITLGEPSWDPSVVSAKDKHRPVDRLRKWSGTEQPMSGELRAGRKQTGEDRVPEFRGLVDATSSSTHCWD
jgi:hypothetical protein